jgi:hypothetical protein
VTSLTRIAAAAMLIGLASASSRAGYVVELTQEESDVVATGSGYIDTSGLTLVGQNTSTPTNIWPASGFINAGPTTSVPLDFYAGPIVGPTTFGSGVTTFANSGSGDSIEIIGASVPFEMPILLCRETTFPTRPCRTPPHIAARPSVASARRRVATNGGGEAGRTRDWQASAAGFRSVRADSEITAPRPSATSIHAIRGCPLQSRPDVANPLGLCPLSAHLRHS